MRWGSRRRSARTRASRWAAPRSSLLELTAAYAAVLANVGRVEPYVVRAVRAPGSAAFHRPRPAPPRANWPRAQIMELLLEAVRSGTGGAASPRRSGLRQDRDHAGPSRCLVHRLRRGSRGRRLGRQRRQHADARGDRRRAAGQDLAELRGGRAEGARQGGPGRRRRRRLSRHAAHGRGGDRHTDASSTPRPCASPAASCSSKA